MRRVKRSLVAALLLVTASACDARPPAERLMAQMEAQEPVLTLLREQDPAAYADVRALIEAEVARGGGRPDQSRLIQQGRLILARAVQRRTMTASDATEQSMAALTADQASHLESQPQRCVDLLYGTTADLRAVIPVDMQNREKELYRTLLLEPQAPQRAATEAEGVPVVMGILQDAESALGLSAEAIQAAISGVGPQLSVCRVNAYLFRRISQLPPAEGAPLFRLILRVGAETNVPSTAP